MSAAEEWRLIPGFDRYLVSSFGLVASRARGRERLLGGQVDRKGYRSVVLYGADGPVRRKVHILVLASFVGPRPDGQQTRHLDGDRLNNALTNLQYGTPEQNAGDKFSHGTAASLAPRCRRGHELTPDNVRLFRKGPYVGRRCFKCAQMTQAIRKGRRAA